MGIIALLAAVTTVGYRTVAKDAKLASAKNTVMVVLDNARALAIRSNQIVVVVFRPRLEENNHQYVEAILCKTAKKAAAVVVGGNQNAVVVEGYVPIMGVAPRRLPAGIKIAGPAYGMSINGPNVDDVWLTQSHLPAINQSSGAGEVGGNMLAVMYAPDGSTITRNPVNDAARSFVDFNANCLQDIHGDSVDYFNCGPGYSQVSSANYNGGYFEQWYENDEPYLDVVPFIAVFDDDACRERYDSNQWNPAVSGTAALANRRTDYTLFITNNADPIYFNRYTGVAMR